MERKFTVKPSENKSFDINSQCSHTLILYNDDVNDYQFVIDSLVEVCNHNHLQAEQCTLIAHHMGKCDVKSGDFKVLKPLRDELLRRGLSATIVPS